MLRTESDSQQVLENKQSKTDLIATLQRQVSELTTTNKMQRTDIESLKKRLEQFGAENDDLLERLAEMKRDKSRRDEQMKHVADNLRQRKDSRPDNDQLRETRDQLEEARRNGDRLQRDLDVERRRYVELERVNTELQSQLEDVQSAPKPDTQVHDIQREQALKGQIRDLTRQLTESRQRLTDQAGTSSQLKQQLERLVREKAKIEGKNHELSSAMEHLKRKHAISEQQEELLRTQLDKLKRTLEACSITEDDLKKQLQRVLDKNQELEQIQAEQDGAKRTEKILREELEKMKQAEDERTVRQTELKRQLAKAHEDYNILSGVLRLRMSEIDGLKEESRGMNKEINKLNEVNIQLANNEHRLKVELNEAKLEAESGRRKLQQEIDTLRINLQASEEACVKLRKERDGMLEKWVSKERLEAVEAQLKQRKKTAEETEMRIQKLQNEQDALERKALEREQELNEEAEKLRSELKTKEKRLEEFAKKSVELEQKNEKLKQSCDEKEKLFKRGHEKLEQTMKEQNEEFQEKMKAEEAQHLVEKEHMLKLWNEKEKELKNRMKASKFEIRTEVDKVKSKCEQLERVHEEKMRQKDVETKCQISKLKGEIEERNKLMEEAKDKNKELQKVVDGQVSQMNELTTLRGVNDDLKQKVGKLERAVLRLRLDNDELREHKVHIDSSHNELLRQAFKDLSKPSPRLGVPPPIDATQSPADIDHGRLLGEMFKLLKTTAQDGRRSVEDSSTLTKQLEAERRKVRAGSERIAQLEHWLDTIFNDQRLGIGPSVVSGSTQQTSQITLPPLNGASTVPAATNSKTQATNKPLDRSPNKQKQPRTSRPKRQ